MKTAIYYMLLLIVLGASCIGNDYVDDEVEPVLQFTNPIDSIAIDSSYQFEYRYLNNVGREEEVEVLWNSSDDEIISVTNNGLATAHNPGNASISIEYEAAGKLISVTNEIGVGDRTVVSSTERSGQIKSTSSYKLSGDFVLKTEPDGKISLNIGDNYEATDVLPGLYVYLSNNPNTTSGAKEIQAVQVFKGAHSYIIEGVELNQYNYVLYFCKPFNVKVGDGLID